ncbi:GGDEF domain-containing protein [Clostridium sp. CF012]|uniref:GGDEF domain-containing protein n=1 Tax=Clostridium sp. CF012 TaxID=2843319 RepID=UPI001C0C0713|nr:GGDEF domain-containing protein [Clostridium sp. CF012]MBU3142664.1 GGDEF domain-containing protein [Clostridium sp. CF012]
MEIIEIIKERLSIFKNLYDTVRVVDPINKKVVNFEGGNTEIVADSCFGFWKTDGYCKNCISMRACLENDTFIKMEVIGAKVFLIISSPVTIEDKVYIVEMLKDVSQTGSIINNEKKIINIENLIKEMNDAAIRDELTGMYNRRYINERLQLDINDSMISNKPLCVVMADLDFFKDVNDNYGHVVGDWVLKDFAKILSSSVRSDSDWVGRYGGEEFLIVLRNTDGNNAFEVIEKIRKLVQENVFEYKDIKIKITSSFGGYITMNEKITIDELINKADKNLYSAKNSGRNKTIILHSEDHFE